MNEDYLKNLPYFTPFKFTLPKPWYKRGELTEVWLYTIVSGSDYARSKNLIKSRDLKIIGTIRIHMLSLSIESIESTEPC